MTNNSTRGHGDSSVRLYKRSNRESVNAFRVPNELCLALWNVFYVSGMNHSVDLGFAGRFRSTFTNQVASMRPLTRVHRLALRHVKSLSMGSVGSESAPKQLQFVPNGVAAV